MREVRDNVPFRRCEAIFGSRLYTQRSWMHNNFSGGFMKMDLFVLLHWPSRVARKRKGKRGGEAWYWLWSSTLEYWRAKSALLGEGNYWAAMNNSHKWSVTRDPPAGAWIWLAPWIVEASDWGHASVQSHTLLQWGQHLQLLKSHTVSLSFPLTAKGQLL